MRQQRNILREIEKDNRGSGIVMVLVCMLCVTLMGAAMLSMSYTGLRIKVAQRQAEKDFYSAETAVDEIRAGIQGLVSEAIASAYKEVLITYNDGSDVINRFQTEFQNLVDGKIRAIATHHGNLQAGLQTYISNNRALVTAAPVWNNVSLTLKGIKVSYTADNGYVTDIETDLVISVPDFAYVMSTYSISGLPEHALIAKEELKQIVGSSVITVDGSAYAGKINLSGTGSQLTLKDGTMVCAGSASVSDTGSGNNARLKVDDSARLWAERITVNIGSSVELGGETCVLDDLDLSGTGASATLRGSYYGFGNGTTDDGSGTSANRSSAILVNGRDSVLDMSGLNRLMLAGRSYISNSFFVGSAFPEGLSEANVETLESVSVRSDQKLYLVPAEYLKSTADPSAVITNPYIYTPVSGATNAADAVVLTDQGRAMLKNDEWEADMKPLTAVLPGAGGQRITYYFLDFKNKNSANAYFERYFASHSGAISSYLTTGTNLNAKNSSAAGYTLRGTDGNYTVSRSEGIGFDCTGMRSTFNQLKKTLIDSNTNAAENNPYDYIVYVNKVADVSSIREFQNAAGKPVGLVVNNGGSGGTAYTVDSSTPSTVRLIIANGDVLVKASFTGLIISGSTITVEGSDTNIKADEDGVVDSFEGTAVDDSTVTLGSYPLHGGNQSGAQGGAGGGSAGWNLDKLVTYRNWTKN